MREEDIIQKSICDWIAAVAPTVICYAVPNASRRTAGGRASNAVPGLREGVWDLALVLPAKTVIDGKTATWHVSRPAFIEVKTPREIKKANRGLSPGQRQYELDLIRTGTPHEVCASIDDVRAFFRRIGVPTREVHAAPRFPGAVRRAAEESGMRHRWSVPDRPSELRTERVCARCGMRKITRHDGGPAAIPWTEFYRMEGVEPGQMVGAYHPTWSLVDTGRTPKCEPVASGTGP